MENGFSRASMILSWVSRRFPEFHPNFRSDLTQFTISKIRDKPLDVREISGMILLGTALSLVFLHIPRMRKTKAKGREEGKEKRIFRSNSHLKVSPSFSMLLLPV